MLSGAGKIVNVTLCFSAKLALPAAKAGATFISPFGGRLDDINTDGMDLIAEIRQISDTCDAQGEILVASVRSVNQAKGATLIGAEVMTAPTSVIEAVASHPLTDTGLTAFLKGAEAAGQKIV